MSLTYRRWIISAPVILGVLVMSVPPAHSDGAAFDAQNSEQVAITGRRTFTSQGSFLAPVRRGGLRRTGVIVTYILDSEVRMGADGNPCVFIGQVEGIPGSLQEANNETTALRLLSQYPRCAGSA